MGKFLDFLERIDSLIIPPDHHGTRYGAWYSYTKYAPAAVRGLYGMGPAPANKAGASSMPQRRSELGSWIYGAREGICGDMVDKKLT